MKTTMICPPPFQILIFVQERGYESSFSVVEIEGSPYAILSDEPSRGTFQAVRLNPDLICDRPFEAYCNVDLTTLFYDADVHFADAVEFKGPLEEWYEASMAAQHKGRPLDEHSFPVVRVNGLKNS